MKPVKLAGRSNTQECAGESLANSGPVARGDFEMIAPIALTPLTGRDTEFSLLKDRWEQAQEGMGQIVLVVGEAGLGKSRLVQTITQLVQDEASDASAATASDSASTSVDLESPVIEWRCSQHFQNSELFPVSDFMERFLGFARDGGASGHRFPRSVVPHPHRCAPIDLQRWRL